MMLKKIKILGGCIFLGAMMSVSLTTEVAAQSLSIDPGNKERLQRGAKLFMNYCSGCHSLKYMHYNRLAEDLGLTGFTKQINQKLLNNLIFTQATTYDPIYIAMPPEQSRQWFGVIPPDLSLSARERGAHWLYLYLKNFYNDNSRPLGVNNLLVPNVAMPNALESLMGQQILVVNNKSHEESLRLIKRGEMLPADFDNALEDLVTFLVYVGEPAQLIRYRLGIFVILFLLVLFVAAYNLKKSYWRHLK